MKEFWSMVQMIFTGIGGWLGYFLGGCDGLIIARSEEHTSELQSQR